MDNQQNQQQNNQPTYQPQPGFLAKIYGTPNTLFQKILKIFSLVLFGLAVIAFFDHFLVGIINAAGVYGSFSSFWNGLTAAISSFFGYIFSGLVIVGIYTLIRK